MIARVLAAWVCLGVLSALAAPVRVQDDAGQLHVFASPPRRIVSLTPHLTELLFAVGAGGQVVGVDAASDHPPAARRLPRVGDYSRLHLERILALQPDLIVAWLGGNRAADLHAVKQLGIPVLLTEAVRLDDVARLLELLGHATGHAGTGRQAAHDYRARLAALKARYGRANRVPVFYQVWDRPLMTLGGHHWISEALALCGARNVFGDLGGWGGVVSREAVLRREPVVILGGADGPDLGRSWQAFRGLAAVRQEAYVRVDADRLHRASPRLIEGVEALCRAITPYGR